MAGIEDRLQTGILVFPTPSNPDIPETTIITIFISLCRDEDGDDVEAGDAGPYSNNLSGQHISRKAPLPDQVRAASGY
jgi:hypothetical protein